MTFGWRGHGPRRARRRAGIHRTLRVTSAMAAGVTDRLWEVSDLVVLLEAEERGLERAAFNGPTKRVLEAFLRLLTLALRRANSPRIQDSSW